MATPPRKIVVGFDGSACALRALDAAAELMGYGSTMTVVSVASERSSEGSDPLGLAREVLVGRLVSARYERRIGDAAEAIVGAADDIDADVIVVGRRGPVESNEPLQGSVSADVVRRAHCDVLVVG